MNMKKISIGLLSLLLALVIVPGALAAHSTGMGYPSDNTGVAKCQNCHISSSGPTCNACGHTASPTFSLSLVAVPTSVPALSSTPITLTVSKSNNVKNVKTPASGATVSLNGAGVITSGTTNAAGIVTKTVNPTGASAIKADATLTGFNSGTTSVTVTTASAALKITAPAGITKVSTGTLTAVSLGTATAIGGTAPYTITNNAPSAGFPVGTTTVTWTAKDSKLATATATQIVTITAKSTGTATLTFVVTDSKGTPLPGAKIEVSYKGIEIKRTTDNYGKATITVASGNYKYEIEKNNYREIEGKLYVTGSKLVPVTLVKEQHSKKDDYKKDDDKKDDDKKDETKSDD